MDNVFFSNWDICVWGAVAWVPIALVSMFTDATKVTLFAVSVVLVLTNLARTDFLVVAAAASALKYSSRASVEVSGGPPGGAGGGAYPSLPISWAAPN